jgi:hypothetical protein
MVSQVLLPITPLILLVDDRPGTPPLVSAAPFAQGLARFIFKSF